LKHKLTKHY